MDSMEAFAKNFKYIVTIESFLGVSRTWTFSDEQTWTGLFSAAIWIVSSISVSFYIGTYMYYYDHEYSEGVVRFNTVITFSNTILTIIWACATSKQFKELLFHLSEAHLNLKRYPGYLRKRSNHYAVVGFMIIIFLVVNALGSIILTAMRLKSGVLNIPFVFYWLNLVYLASLIRAGIGYLLFYSILKVVSVQLEFIATDANEIAKKLRNTTSKEGKVYEDYAKSLDKLCTAYIHMCDSCRLINTIFSVPTSTSFGLLVFYHIVIAFVLTTQNMTGGVTPYQTALYALMLLPNLVALVTIAVAGQRVHNNADSITRALAYLLTVTNAEGAFYSVTRRAVRVANARPLRLVIFGSTQIGTALLPASLAFFTTYLIIALQFNNVL